MECINSDEKKDMTRRDFVTLSWRVLGAVALGQAAYVGLRLLSSRKPEGAFGTVVTAGLVPDFPPGTITPFDSARFFLVRLEDGGFLALHSKCTHLACIVAWNATTNCFVCPCHGSEFDKNGQVILPPAPRALDRFAVIIEDEKVKVDTRKRLLRDSDNAIELVYASKP